MKQTKTVNPTNPKNRLQEYCYEQKIDLPIYDSQQTQHGFKSTVTITTRCDRHPRQSEKRAVGIALRKKDAEKVAAHNLMTSLKTQKVAERCISHNQLRSKSNYVAVYIDIENINVKHLQQLFDSCAFDPTQFLFIGCLSTGHHHALTLFEYKGIAFQKILVPSTRSDAADIGMIMHALTHHDGKAHTVVFVSRDRFSCVFAELADKGFCTNKSSKYQQCSNFEEMTTLLSNSQNFQ